MQTNLFEDRQSIIPIGRPIDDAPPSTASLEERTEWAERYVAWFMGRIEWDGPLPQDAAPTHLYQVEFDSCVLDPQAYERATLDELVTKTALAH